MKSPMITENQIALNENIVLKAKSEIERHELQNLYIKIMDFKHQHDIETILEAIVDYSEVYELDVLDIADIIKKDQTMVDVFTTNLLESNQIEFKDKESNNVYTMDDWL